MPNAGPSSEPAHDAYTLRRQLGTKGKWLTVFGKGQGWRSVSGMWVKMCLHSGGRASITQSWHNSRKPESWNVCWILQPTPLVVQMGKLRPRKEGTCPGSSTWQQSQLGDWGTWVLAQFCSTPGSYCSFQGKGKNWVAMRIQNSGRAGHSKYLIAGHYYQRFTFCIMTHSQEKDWERQVSPHH